MVQNTDGGKGNKDRDRSRTPTRDQSDDKDKDKDKDNKDGKNKGLKGLGKGGPGLSTKGKLALPPHLLTFNDYEDFYHEIRYFFKGGKEEGSESSLKMSAFNALFTNINKEISGSVEIIAALGLEPSKDMAAFLQDAKVLDYSGSMTMSNKTVDKVSSMIETYYLLPGKVYEFCYHNADAIISAINSFNAGAAVAVILASTFRKLIAVANLRNFMQGHVVREAYWQGFIQDADNSMSTLVGRRYGKEAGYSIAFEGMSKQMCSELPSHEVTTGAVNHQTVRKYAVFCIKNAAPGGNLTEIMTVRTRLLGVAPPAGCSMPMNFILKLLKVMIRNVGIEPNTSRMLTYLDGGSVNITNGQRGNMVAGQPASVF